MTFEKLGVRPEIIKALKEINITDPTPIQEETIALIKSGKHLVGISKTGSGKTAAFGVPAIEMVEPKKGVQILILCPTRELAVQIGEELRKFAKYVDCKVATVYGGVAINPQMESIARSQIVVGTPGRLLDHLERRTLNLSKIKCVILDEADKMAEMGFIEDITRIINYTPNERQVLLFGATTKKDVSIIKKRYMNNPETIRTESHVKEEFLEQYYYNLKHNEKFSYLVHLLKKETAGRVIVFCATRRTVDIVSKNLRKQGFKVESIHGKLTQHRRTAVIDDFNKNKFDILVASAVAARGLHIEHVSHVYNYDLSDDPEEYIHRVGRTARAGKTGKAITLLSDKDHFVFREIVDKNPTPIEMLEKEDFPQLRFDVGQRDDDRRGDSRGGFSRGRRSSGQSRGGFGNRRSGDRRSSGNDSSGRSGNRSSGGRSDSNRSSSRGQSSNKRSGDGNSNRSGGRSNRSDSRSDRSGARSNRNDSSRGSNRSDNKSDRSRSGSNRNDNKSNSSRDRSRNK
ncbi:DEAD/DEAH box helicase [Nanoarchaeota archaeon]